MELIAFEHKPSNPWLDLLKDPILLHQHANSQNGQRILLNLVLGVGGHWISKKKKYIFMKDKDNYDIFPTCHCLIPNLQYLNFIFFILLFNL